MQKHNSFLVSFRGTNAHVVGGKRRDATLDYHGIVSAVSSWIW